MMVGVTAVGSMHELTAILNHASLYDFSSPNIYGKFTFYPSKSIVKVLPYKNYMLPPQSQGGKLSPRTVAYGMPHKNDDPLFIFPDSEDDKNSEEPRKETNAFLVQPISDLQPTVPENINQESLLEKLKAIQLHILAMEQWNASRVKMCHRNYSASATNLIHYLALKSLDIEQTKQELFPIGILNLEMINPHILLSLSACIKLLIGSRSDSIEFPNIHKISEYRKDDLSMANMTKRASSYKDTLLGTLQDPKKTRIMVTVGQEAEEKDSLIPDLINAGTHIFRINCAHGNPEIWGKIITRVRRSSQLLEKPCRVLMDLAGPKLRTGRLNPGPCVAKISPKRGAVGNVIRTAQVWLSPQGSGPPPPHLSPDIVLHVDGQDFLSKLKVNDTIEFFDSRGKQENFKILSECPIFSGVGFMAECTKTAYVENGTNLYVKSKKRKSPIGFIVDIPPSEQYIRLRAGDLLTISRDSNSPESDKSITCPSGYLFDSVKPGEPISFDDGKIWGVIKGTSQSEIVVSITHVGPKGSKLGSEKSINIPDSEIRYEGLTSKDLIDLDFVAAHADVAGVSFIRDVRDIIVLRQELEKRKFSKLGIVLKIETKGGFEKLPLLILEAMKSPNPLGVMIARGDLAVECGWEKLADIQEEIIGICSAAHVPVILATQVLESLVKSGVPTRAEITDADNGRRTSCVMLNKGEHIVKAVSVLDTILNSQCTKTKAELKPLVLSSHVN